MKKGLSNKDIFVFILWFIAIFSFSYAGLYILGFVPKEIDESGRETVLDKLNKNTLETVIDENIKNTEKGELPIRLKIPSINIDILIQNPETTDLVLLDGYLKTGIVRYPGSGLPGNGNVLLFGHSSNWAVVKNPNYKALNGIENLKAGDEVYIKGEKSGDYTYVYKVRSVKMAPASEIKIDFGIKENLLTISTCNTFGAKEDRYVVEAVFVSKEIK